jgi:ribosomal-protein-alanine N-acetyltransferase
MNNPILHAGEGARPSLAPPLPDETVWIRDASEHDLDHITEIERVSHAFPWDRVHFQDCLNAGYAVHVLTVQNKVLGYTVAMQAPDEVHLLNITVAPQWQGQGLGGFLLRALMTWSISRGAHSLWLEVRDSNLQARAVYETLGFVVIRRRKDYYPAGAGHREDAWVMRLDIANPPTKKAKSPLLVPVGGTHD